MRRLHLSPSRIGSFRRCPFRYQLEGDKDLRARWQKGHPHLWLGAVLHNTLRSAYRQGRVGSLPWPEVEKIYREEWRDFDWKSQGYGSREEAVADFQQGREWLERYWASRPPERPLQVEVGLQHPLEGVTVTGRIDRIDQWDDGTLEVIDYKTGKNSLSEEELAGDLQMGIYALLVQKKYAPPRLVISHVYLRENEKVTATDPPPAADVAAAVEAVAAEIQATADFAPRKNSLCQWCDFAPLCPHGPVDAAAVEGLLPAAEKEAQRAPGYWPIRLRLATFYRHLGRHEEAAEACTAALAVQDTALGRYQRALSRLALGDREGAAADARRALELPEDPALPQAAIQAFLDAYA